MHEFARRFEDEIGEIVVRFPLPREAQGLSRTAESTEKLSSVVSQASEVSSMNAGSVAAASEELASSVNEISGRESATIASAAASQT
jgi:methyl-accepting chemotaxis protein